MIRTLVVNCTPVPACSKHDGKTVADTASDEMVMRAVWASCEISLLVSEKNHSDPSLNSLDDALKAVHQKKGIFREQNMSKSAKAKVDDLLVMESHL
jgi:hypothetical protein